MLNIVGLDSYKLQFTKLLGKLVYHGWMGRAYSPTATERDNKVFGHYLDCEAHLDMLLHLNKTANHTNEK